MKTGHFKAARGLAGLLISATLAACGGGDGGGTPTPSPTPTVTPPPTPTPTPTPPSTDLIKVAYVGGSVTYGSFATTPGKSYAGLLTAWLGTTYREVQARNLGFPGTGSEFANYRLEHDLAGFVPDLVLLEFTVNDAGAGRSAIFPRIDALIYKLRRINPRVRIVYVSITDAVEEPQRRAGGRAAFVEDSVAVASFTGIPFIDASTLMWARVLAGTPSTTFLGDGVHPTDAGHQIYFEAIRDGLAPSVPFATLPASTASRLVDQSKLDTARMLPGNTATGCRPAVLAMDYMKQALACDSGDSFRYRFTGTTIGMVRAMVLDGGRLECTIDGGNPMKVDFYDSVTRYWQRPWPIFLYRNLADAEHELACRVTGEVISLPEGTSTGNKATVGHFLVSSERPVTLP